MYFQISKKEQLKADMTSLLALCEKADNDIRFCLNTLQVSLQGFLKTASNTVSLLSSVLHESLLPIFFSLSVHQREVTGSVSLFSSVTQSWTERCSQKFILSLAKYF